MTIESRLDEWAEQGTISTGQHGRLHALAREEPFSLFLELNILLYAGVLAFVAGLGWTVVTWSKQLGDFVIFAVLSTILAASFGYCFAKAPAWSRRHGALSSPVLDYVLYLGCLVWCIELAYLERRFHLLTGQWDLYLLITAALFFLLAYRFDNRFVLSLALSSLAGWLGVTISRLPFDQDAAYRRDALFYCLIVGAVAVLSRFGDLKQHFFGTYLNVVANVLFCALLSGVFKPHDYAFWFVALLFAIAASLSWGIMQRQFVFVAYAAVYGYIGVSQLLLRNSNNGHVILSYFVTTAIIMLIFLVKVAQHFGRSE